MSTYTPKIDPGVYTDRNSTYMNYILIGNINDFIEAVKNETTNVKQQNNSGITTLMLAAIKGNLELVKFICKRTSRNFITQECNLGLTAAQHALDQRPESYGNIVTYLSLYAAGQYSVLRELGLD